MNIYLSGPIYQNNKQETEDWRTFATQRLFDEGIFTIDPCRNKATYRNGIHTPGEILFRDLKDVDNADLVLVNMNLVGDKLPIGTVAEVMYAWSLQKPVVIVHHNDERIKQHPWLRALSVRMFPIVEDALIYIADFWR